MKLSENIKNIRKAKGLRQEQLAEAMGVSTASVSKWETGQTAPELTVLVDLADFFEVSIDALMGHMLTGNRMEDMLAEMNEQEEEGNFEQAIEIAEKLLQCYPNSEKIVDEVAKIYYRVFVATGERTAIEKSIDLTKRMFALGENTTGTKKYELLSSLGNQYALVGDWEQARKYYTEGNVGGMNDRALAGLLAQEGKDKEAVGAISEILTNNLFHILTDVFLLNTSWTNLGESKKADATLLWGINLLEHLEGDAVAHLMPMKSTMYLLLAMSAEEREDTQMADTYVKGAMQCTGIVETDSKMQEFLVCSEKERLIGTAPTTPEMVIGMLKAFGAERLVEVAENM